MFSDFVHGSYFKHTCTGISDARENEKSKRKNIIFSGLGIPSGNQEQEKVVLKCINEILRVTCGSQDIDRIIELPKFGNGGGLLVKFISMSMRQQILSRRIMLRGSKVWMDEDVTKDVIAKRKSLREKLLALRRKGKIASLQRDPLRVDGKIWLNGQKPGNQSNATSTDNNGKFSF